MMNVFNIIKSSPKAINTVSSINFIGEKISLPNVVRGWHNWLTSNFRQDIRFIALRVVIAVTNDINNLYKARYNSYVKT